VVEIPLFPPVKKFFVLFVFFVVNKLASCRHSLPYDCSPDIGPRFAERRSWGRVGHSSGIA
jgi:hypothetical protein